MGGLAGLLPHGAAVHIPLALAVLFPLFFVVCLVSVRTGSVGEGAWKALWVLAVMQLIAIGFALITGEQAEVFSPGAGSLIERHEEFAKIFAVHWAAITLALGLCAWRPRLRPGILHTVTMVLLLSQLGLGIYVGKLGGQL